MGGDEPVKIYGIRDPTKNDDMNISKIVHACTCMSVCGLDSSSCFKAVWA